MVALPKISARTATQEDQPRLARLIHFDAYVHRHLDYRPPLEWVGCEPFIILESNEGIEAALACPPDPPITAWIRLFAASHSFKPQKAWEILWEEAKHQLMELNGLAWAAAIPLQRWFQVLLQKSRFELTHQIVMMKREQHLIAQTQLPAWLVIRPMTLDDLDAIQIVDEASFVPVWRNSKNSIEYAFRQAAIATVAEVEGEVVGYQISTPTHMGGHLARLAVLPHLRERGIGEAILNDVLVQFERRGGLVISVNTQKDNQASLRLYKKAGFTLSGEEYPIFQYQF